MNRNLSNWDRMIRVVLAALFAYFYFAGIVTGGWGIVLLVLGVVFLGTAIVGFCPLYAAVKFRTLKN
jgi:hypothetical protein